MPIVQDAVTKCPRCVVDVKSKAEFEDGCSPRRGSGRWGVGSGERAVGPHTLRPFLSQLVIAPIARLKLSGFIKTSSSFLTNARIMPYNTKLNCAC